MRLVLRRSLSRSTKFKRLTRLSNITRRLRLQLEAGQRAGQRHGSITPPAQHYTQLMSTQPIKCKWVEMAHARRLRRAPPLSLKLPPSPPTPLYRLNMNVDDVVAERTDASEKTVSMNYPMLSSYHLNICVILSS